MYQYININIYIYIYKYICIYIYTDTYIYIYIYMFQGSGFAAIPPWITQNFRNFEDSDLMPAMSGWQRLDVI